MPTTSGLALPTIAESQTQKFQTHNDALNQIDRALTAWLAVDLSFGDAVLTLDQCRNNQVIALSGAAVPGRTLTIPDVARLLIVALDTASSQSVDIVHGTESYTLDPGAAAVVFAGGPAPGFIALGLGAIDGGGGGGGGPITPATTEDLGGVIVGLGLGVDPAGLLRVALGDWGLTYDEFDRLALAPAATNVLGGIIPKDGLYCVTNGGLYVGLDTGLKFTLSTPALIAPDFGTTAGKIAEGNDSRFPPAVGGQGLKMARVNAAATALEYVAIPWEAGIPIGGKPTAAEVINFPMASPVRFAASLAGSRYTGATAPTGSAVTTFKKNGVSIGTMTVSAGAFTATFAGAGADFAAGDVLRVEFPAVQDATWADFGISLYGERR